MRKYPTSYKCPQCNGRVVRLGRFCRSCWTNPIRRFWKYVFKSEKCWIWVGITRNGYGRLRVNKHKISAHRFSYELHHGRIPDGLEVLHKCDMPPCVNPTHLFVGTTADNMMDMISKGRHSRANAKFTDKQVQEMRYMYYKEGKRVKDIAPLYGSNIHTAFGAISGRNYKHLKCR